jgi:hypothetical protein
VAYTFHIHEDEAGLARCKRDYAGQIRRRASELILTRRACPNLSSGIPNEGVVVYEIDEAVPPSPLHLRATPRALGVGEQYTNSAFQFQVEVLAAVPGGFQVKVQSVENPQCSTLRGEIAALKSEIASLQSDLENATGSQKAAIAAEIKQKQGQLHQKELEYAGLGCKS